VIKNSIEKILRIGEDFYIGGTRAVKFGDIERKRKIGGVVGFESEDHTAIFNLIVGDAQ
jgi:hypothetical protein